MTDILLVDDDSLVRKVVRVVLEAEGYSVQEAEDGAGALEVVEADKPAAVVLDLVIPGTDGLDICRRIKAGNPDVKVLVLTSQPRTEAEPASRAAGADEVMTKPFSAMTLLDLLRGLVKETSA